MLHIQQECTPPSTPLMYNCIDNEKVISDYRIAQLVAGIPSNVVEFSILITKRHELMTAKNVIICEMLNDAAVSDICVPDELLCNMFMFAHDTDRFVCRPHTHESIAAIVARAHDMFVEYVICSRAFIHLFTVLYIYIHTTRIRDTHELNNIRVMGTLNYSLYVSQDIKKQYAANKNKLLRNMDTILYEARRRIKSTFR